jgi:CDP-paratose 2-epimerase
MSPPPRTAVAAPALASIHPILVTGGAGFIGCNLVDRLAQEGHDVLVYDSLERPGVEQNLAWVKSRHPRKVTAVIADIRDADALGEAAARAAAVFHYAAQVAVTTSMVDPITDFEINAMGTLRLLDRLRRRPNPPPLIFASTNKVYGDLADVALDCVGDAYLPRDPELRRHGVSETRQLDFHTPYGCSKGTADQYVLDWARSFGVPTLVMRMSCIYGPRQLGTEDQGWVAHFVRRAVANEPITIYGDGKQVRDLLHVRDAVNAYIAAWRRIASVAGRAFNLGGGPGNAVSLVQIVAELERRLGRSVDLQFEDWRPGDQRYFVADTRRVRAALDLPATMDWRSGLADLTDWLVAPKERMSAGALAMPAELAS